MPAALSVDRLTKQYRAGPRGRTEVVRALDAVSICADRGDILGITGGRGSGKSTLLLCAAGLVRPDAGTVAWFGSRIIGRSVPPGIAYVPQRSSYYSFLTVREALEYYATLHDLRTADRARQVDRAVREVALDEHASRRVGCLAPPLLQRLGLAQALIGSPRALLLDETLTPELAATREIRAVLQRLAAGGAIILITAEDASDIAGLAHRIFRLSNGRLARSVETAGFTAAAPSRAPTSPLLVS